MRKIIAVSAKTSIKRKVSVSEVTTCRTIDQSDVKNFEIQNRVIGHLGESKKARFRDPNSAGINLNSAIKLVRKHFEPNSDAYKKLMAKCVVCCCILEDSGNRDELREKANELDPTANKFSLGLGLPFSANTSFQTSSLAKKRTIGPSTFQVKKELMQHQRRRHSYHGGKRTL